MARTEYWCDPSIAADSGTGTVGDPFGDLQYALDNITADTTNGDTINLKAGTAEVLSAKLDLSTYGEPIDRNSGLAIRGYATTAGDGDLEAGTGIAEIDCNGFAGIGSSTSTGLHLIHLKIHNCGSNTAVTVSSTSHVVECEIYDCGIAVQATAGTVVFHCHFHDCNGSGCTYFNNSSAAVENYYESGTLSKYWTGGANFNFQLSQGNLVLDNIVHMKSAHTSTAGGLSGTSLFGDRNYTRGNTIFAENTPTGHGIILNNPQQNLGNDRNLIEGFDGAGAYAIASAANSITSLYNAEFNCTNDFSTDTYSYIKGNETLSVTGLAKSGSISFANRLTYFANVDTGSVRTATPHGVDKGAVQSAAAGSPAEFILMMWDHRMRDPYQVHRVSPVTIPYDGSSALWGEDGVPQVDVIHHPAGMKWQQQDRKRYPQQSIQAAGPPEFFGPEVVVIDWDEALDYNLPRPRIYWGDTQIEGDLVTLETITIDKWYSGWGNPTVRSKSIDLSPFGRFQNLETIEEVFLDKWDSKQHYVPIHPRLRMGQFPLWEVNQELPEQITLDKWYSPLSTPKWKRFHPKLKLGNLGEEPIPEVSLLPTRIPWDVRMGYEFHQRVILPIPEMLVYQEIDTDENIFVDKWGGIMSTLPRSPQRMSQFPFRLVVEETTPEEITIDKWDSPFSALVPRRPPPPSQPFKWPWVPLETDEQITMDKWYASVTAMEPWPYRARRAVTGPEGQSVAFTVNTAPWIKFSVMDPFPIPNVPGVYEWWMTSMVIPIQLFRGKWRDDQDFLRLYQALQLFPVPVASVPECETPRRRTAVRVGERRYC